MPRLCGQCRAFPRPFAAGRSPLSGQFSGCMVYSKYRMFWRKRDKKRGACDMMDSLDNAFVLERIFGHDTDVFDGAILSEVNFGFGSNIPVSPHPQFMRLSLEFQTFCKAIDPPKRWERDTWDSVYIYLTVDPIRIEMNLREAAMEKNPLKVLSHKTEFLYHADWAPDHPLPYYCTEFTFEENYQLKFVHSIGHIQHISPHKEYIQ